MSFWSGLGKFFKAAAPIAASFIPGVGPVAGALIGAGTGAATGAMGGGGGKGALIGGLLGGAGGALGGVGGAAKAAGQGLSTGQKIAQGAGKFLTSLAQPDTLAGISRGTGALADTMAHNRGVELDAMMAADQQQLLANRDRRDDEGHIMRQLQTAEYLKGGGAAPTPKFASGGRKIPDFGFGPRAATDVEKQAAGTLEQQLLSRLNTVPTLRDYDSKMKPGTAESILNWAGPISGIAGEIMRNRPQQAQQQQPELPPTLPLTTLYGEPIQATTPESIFNPNPKPQPSKPFSNLFE